MRVAVIPARGGSKRIPKKNIRSFCGQPMIAWSIKAALESDCFDRVLVSTNDSEIMEIARRHGAEVPFKRPERLADDHSSVTVAMAHAVEWLVEEGVPVDAACLIYATAPFVRGLDLIDGLVGLEKASADFSLSVTSYAFPIQRAVRITDSGRLTMFKPEELNTRSQDLLEAYHDAGQFCWGRPEAWLEGKHWFSETCAPVIIPRYRVQDIDTYEDWKRAEYMFRALSSDSTG